MMHKGLNAMIVAISDNISGIPNATVNTSVGQSSGNTSGQSTSDYDLLAAKEAARAEAMAKRVGIIPKVAGAGINPNIASPAGAVGGRLIRIYLIPFLPKTQINLKLGHAHSTFTETTPLPEAIDQLVNMWNPAWEKDSLEKLTRHYLTLRFLDDINPLPDSELQSVGYFYDVHMKTMPDAIMRLPPTTKPGKGPYVYLKACLSVEDFEDDTGATAPYWVKPVPSKKRKAEEVSSQALKKLRSTAPPLVSTWATRAPENTTQVKLVFGQIMVNKITNEHEVIWPESPNPVMGHIADEWFDMGATKYVHKASLGDQEFAAKRYYNGGRERDVSIEENKEEVSKEGIRLYQLADILPKFLNHSRKSRATIMDDIRVTEFKVAAEQVPPGGYPSPASGISKDAWDSLDDSGKEFAALWLLEPLRATTAPTTKWSGTMQHPTPTGMLGATMTALAHFAYKYTHNTIVFADLQSTRIAADKGGVNILLM
ncbi:hypothetical protein AAF712_010221 [Marasmius tenuissimus]|uniref:Alpha-type protein kinase domain-containing protein n=1 Tax=Marasmius tenuissimus TaxID=585030 RepID=A0ABR2ZNR1_9AGAR